MKQEKFTARVITGSGRGKTIGTPTVNIDLSDVPTGTKEGIYAGWVKIENDWRMAAIHYGPRPVFKDTTSFEVYLLDTTLEQAPETLEIELTEWLREVMDFHSKEDLIAQIAQDIDQTRAILNTHVPRDSQTADS